jgi:hypothetical protein
MSNLRSSLIRRERTPVRSPRPLTAGKRRENNFVPTEIISDDNLFVRHISGEIIRLQGRFRYREVLGNVANRVSISEKPIVPSRNSTIINSFLSIP